MGETERSRAEVGVWLLAGLAFVVGTVELVVAGVLDELAASFAVSQGRAGLLMSLYALVYALLGPLLVYLSAGIERRRLLAGALLVFIGANLASAAAPSFALLLASRLLVAGQRLGHRGGGDHPGGGHCRAGTARPGDRSGVRRHRRLAGAGRTAGHPDRRVLGLA